MFVAVLFAIYRAPSLEFERSRRSINLNDLIDMSEQPLLNNNPL